MHKHPASIVVNGSLTGFNAQFQIEFAIGLASFEADGDPDKTFHDGNGVVNIAMNCIV